MEKAILNQNQVSNLVTTLRGSTIGSSFSKGDNYFVSTIGVHSLGQYETIIKVVGISGAEICKVFSRDPLTAVMNHIGMTRMGISTDPTDWNGTAVNIFMPREIKGFLDEQLGHQDVNSFKSEFPIQLLSMSGINFPPSAESGGSGSKFCFVATACFGSSDSDTVITLRRYREVILKQSTVGRFSIYWYYKLSPPVAHFVANHSQAKKIVRRALVMLAEKLSKKYRL